MCVFLKGNSHQVESRHYRPLHQKLEFYRSIATLLRSLPSLSNHRYLLVCYRDCYCCCYIIIFSIFWLSRPCQSYQHILCYLFYRLKCSHNLRLRKLAYFTELLSQRPNVGHSVSHIFPIGFCHCCIFIHLSRHR